MSDENQINNVKALALGCHHRESLQFTLSTFLVNILFLIHLSTNKIANLWETALFILMFNPLTLRSDQWAASLSINYTLWGRLVVRIERIIMPQWLDWSKQNSQTFVRHSVQHSLRRVTLNIWRVKGLTKFLHCTSITRTWVWFPVKPDLFQILSLQLLTGKLHSDILSHITVHIYIWKCHMFKFKLSSVRCFLFKGQFTFPHNY